VGRGQAQLLLMELAVVALLFASLQQDSGHKHGNPADNDCAGYTASNAAGHGNSGCAHALKNSFFPGWGTVI
jgi:hypothetical protein